MATEALCTSLNVVVFTCWRRTWRSRMPAPAELSERRNHVGAPWWVVITRVDPSLQQECEKLCSGCFTWYVIAEQTCGYTCGCTCVHNPVTGFHFLSKFLGLQGRAPLTLIGLGKRDYNDSLINHIHQVVLSIRNS